jgi:gamma-aminobutyric acid receptor subunit rho
VPDVFFVNEKSSFRHTVTMMNTMVRLYPDGNVFYSIRITMKLVCPMQMHKYPLDEQNCSLIMESYSHSEDEMTLYLMSNEALGVNNIDNSINGLKDLTLQQFEVCYK